ncbi:hypothetical protein WA026_002335 [Henosepilachna vigintioctopunctata]|uniref:Cysteine-rich DPF motif domain-containing protein 1 n=1 Tax=Henosepilachna vigintioctopunctata TaxID=420089 RepID=A0AAW1TR31_9CUCU
MDTKDSKEEPEKYDLKGETEEKSKYFECENCNLKVKYDYFGLEPPFLTKYKLKEESFVMKDPFTSVKKGEILILGANCIKCKKCVCKDPNCSFYFNGTYCVVCAKSCISSFPLNVQEKLNKIVI